MWRPASFVLRMGVVATVRVGPVHESIHQSLDLLVFLGSPRRPSDSRYPTGHACREIVTFVDPVNDNPNDEYDQLRFPDAKANSTFSFTRVPARTWTLEALVGQPNYLNALNGTARYYRGGPDDSAGARVLYSGRAPLIRAPSGADFALGCDYMKVRAVVEERRHQLCLQLSAFQT